MEERRLPEEILDDIYELQDFLESIPKEEPNLNFIGYVEEKIEEYKNEFEESGYDRSLIK